MYVCFFFLFVCLFVCLSVCQSVCHVFSLTRWMVKSMFLCVLWQPHVDGVYRACLCVQVDGPIVAEKVRPVASAPPVGAGSWSQKDVHNWLHKHQLNGYCTQLDLEMQ